MGLRATLVLALLVAVLGVVVWRGESPKVDPGVALSLSQADAQPTATPGRLVLEIPPDRVVAVILRQGDRQMELRREAGAWANPMEARTVETLLNDIQGLRVLDEIQAAEAELSDYGLKPARAELEIESMDGQRSRISLGRHNPSGTSVYVRFDATGPVYLAGALLDWKVDGAIKNLLR